MRECRCAKERGRRFPDCPLESGYAMVVTPMAERSQIVEVCPERLEAGYWDNWDRSRAWDAFVEAAVAGRTVTSG